MGSEWRTSSWGEEISLEYGKTLKDYRDGIGKYQVFGSNGPVGWTDEKLADGPGVILGRKGAYRGVRYSPDAFFVIDTAYYVQPKSTFHMRWLYYAIIHYKLGDIDDGSPIPSTTRAAVYVTEFEIPPLPEQHAIAHILGSLDDKIELNRRMNETLEGMAQALFKSWFVDFDPVIDNAIVAGNPIPEELADRAEVRRAALANGTANREAAKQFPAGFQQTEELGWIPVGWEVKPLRKVAVNVRDSVNPAELTPETPYVGLEHIDRKSFTLSRWGLASDVESQKSHFGYCDFLFGKLRPYFHKVCQVQCSGICSTDILVIRPKEEPFRGFVGCQIFHPEFVEYANMRSTGTRMPRASWKDMAKYEIALPGVELMVTFNNLVEPSRQKCKRTVDESQSLTKLRDTLLPKLISGELRIPDAEKLAEAALA